jgi:hypothetical protein
MNNEAQFHLFSTSFALVILTKFQNSYKSENFRLIKLFFSSIIDQFITVIRKGFLNRYLSGWQNVKSTDLHFLLNGKMKV